MKAVDLFAGAGGWTEGAVSVGVPVVAALNHHPLAIEAHRLNHPTTIHLCQDAELIDPRDLPAHNALLASPSCSGYTHARGADRPAHDAARATAWCIVRVAEITRPRLLCIENVTDMVRWPLFTTWLDALRHLDYRLSVNRVQASEYGVPQDRERLIILGLRHRPTPPPLRSPRLPPIPARTILDLDRGDWTPIRNPARVRAISTITRIANGRLRHGPDFLISYYGNTHTGRSLDRPIGTITTRDRWAIVRGDHLRMLTLAENQRAMGFRPDYALAGSRRDRLMQLGNAVPPPLAAGVLRQILPYV